MNLLVWRRACQNTQICQNRDKVTLTFEIQVSDTVVEPYNATLSVHQV